MSVDREAARLAIGAFLTALGHDPERDPELSNTPQRVADAYADELLAGYAADIPQLLGAGTPAQPGAGVVVVRGIHVSCVCPHHLLPSQGHATLAYQPGARVLGLGTLAELVEAYARRLTLQETIGDSVVKALLEHAGAQGAYCRIELGHACLSARGQRQSEARVVTTALAGSFSQAEGTARLALALGEQP